MKRTIPTSLLALMLLAGLVLVPCPVGARTVLATLPERGDVTIRLDNPSATLIEEERVLTLEQGLNRIDFSWKGVSIDVDSIRLTPLTHSDKVRLLSVSFPPGEDALVWEMASDGAFEEKVRIGYLLSNIDRLITYKLVVNKEETRADLRSYLVLRNFSGEDFEKARVLLDYGQPFERGILNEETQQLLFLEAKELPLEKVWTFDAAEKPWDPKEVQGNVGIPVTYRIANNDKAGLGKFALWGGKARAYQEDGRGSTIFSGEDQVDLTPVGEHLEMGIGDSRDIVVTQRLMHTRQTNVRRNKDNEVILFDTDETIRAEVENFKDRPAVLTLIEHIEGEWEMKECSLTYERKDAETLEFKVDLPAKGKKELIMRYSRKNVLP
jgi:hypothetical protein